MEWIVIATVWVLGYMAACWVWPFANCMWCKGVGKVRSPTGRAWRNCRHCRGGGHKLRAGRRLHRWLSATHRAGTKH